MFEYWFTNLSDDQGTFDHTGTTHDFLEVVAQIAQLISPKVAGEFVEALLVSHEKKLPFLRVVDWKFEYRFAQSRDADGIAEGSKVPREMCIKLHKLI